MVRSHRSLAIHTIGQPCRTQLRGADESIPCGAISAVASNLEASGVHALDEAVGKIERVSRVAGLESLVDDLKVAVLELDQFSPLMCVDSWRFISTLRPVRNL